MVLGGILEEFWRGGLLSRGAILFGFGKIPAVRPGFIIRGVYYQGVVVTYIHILDELLHMHNI